MKNQRSLIFFLTPLFFCLFTSLSCYAAGETWVHKYSVPDKSVRFNDVISVSSGGYLGVGNVWDSNTGDTEQNAIISRLGQNGQALWSKNLTFSGRWKDDLRSVVETGDGGFIATGLTRLEGSDGFGGITLVSAVLILKVDANGNTVWRKVVKNKGNSVTSGNRVKATNDGNYVIVGEAMVYRRHDNGNYTPVTLGGLIVKIDGNGTVLFTRAFYGDWTHSYAWTFKDVVQGGDGSYYVTGFAGSELYSEAVGWGGILVAKISKNGALVWVRKLDSASAGKGIGINDFGNRVLLSGGSLYVTGITGPTFNLSRFSLSGARSWTKQYSCVRGWDTNIGATNDFIHSGDGNFYILTGGGCAAIAKVDRQGNVLRGYTTTSRQQPTSLIVSSDKGLVFSSWGGSALDGTQAYINKYDSNGKGCQNNYDIAFTVTNMEMLNNAVPYNVVTRLLSDDQIPVFNGPPLSYEQSCSATPPPTPSRPTGIRATDGKFTDRVRVTFNPVAGATVYRVFRCPDNGNTCGLPIGYPKMGTFDDRKAVPGIVYYYRVRACTTTDCGKFSVANTGFSSTAPAVPGKPIGIKATDGAFPDKVRVTFNTVANATVYRVYRCTTTAGTACGTPIGFPKNGTFDDTKGVIGVVYFYRVRACNAGGCGLFSAANAGSRKALPARPTGIKASDGAFSGRVRVTWSKVSEATVYRLFRCPTTGPDCGLPVGFPKTPVFDDVKGTVGIVYYYRVKACTKTGTRTVCSLFSVANPGHRGNLPSVKADTSNRVQNAHLSSTTPIPVLDSIFGRGLLILMMLGTGMVLVNLRYVRSRE